MDKQSALEWSEKANNGCNREERGYAYDCVIAAPEVEGGQVVEIGSFAGGMSVVLAAACEEHGFRFTCIDTWHQGCVDYQEGEDPDLFRQHSELLINAGLKRHVRCIVDDSLKAGKEITIPNMVFLFVDSFHDNVHAYEEFKDFSPRMVSGGVAAIHDAGEFQVIECINRLSRESHFGGWRECAPHEPYQHDGQASVDGVDLDAPWRTRAWRKG